MDSNQIALADFIRQVRRSKGLSTVAVERASRAGGAAGVSNAYVSQIENNYVQNVSPDKLQALARGLGITDEEIFSVATGRLPGSRTVANERLAAIAENYSVLSAEAKAMVEPLLAGLELTIAQYASRDRKSEVRIVRKLDGKQKLPVVSSENTSEKKKRA